MYLCPGKINRHRFHGNTCLVACDKQIADLDWTITRIDFHSHAPGRGNQHVPFTLLTERNPWLERNHARDTAVVRFRGSNYLVVFGAIEDYDCPGAELL